MKGRITLKIVRVCSYLMRATHAVVRVLAAAQASSPQFDYLHLLHFHISYITSSIKHVFRYSGSCGCLSCFYKMTFQSITWQMMQTQHWNVSSCLCGLVCFHVETERAYNYYTFLVLNSDHVGEENLVRGNIYIPCHDISLHILVTKFSQLDIATKCKLCYLHSYGVSCV